MDPLNTTLPKADNIYMVRLGRDKWYQNRSSTSMWGSVLFCHHKGCLSIWSHNSMGHNEDNDVMACYHLEMPRKVTNFVPLVVGLV